MSEAADRDPLFEPTKIGPVPLTTRLALAPMTRVSACEDGRVSPAMAPYYRRFAEGGFSLLVTEGIYTDTEHSQGYINQPGLATGEQASSWRDVVGEVHGAGAAIFAQLMHAGAQSQGNRYRAENVGPSAIAPPGEQLTFYRGSGAYPRPRALGVEEMSTIRRGFATAARHAREAGFDGVELHGANGYLLDNYLTDYMNHRKDDYGGSARARVRFAAEVCDEVVQAVGADMAVGIRISQSKVSDAHHHWPGGADDAHAVFTALAGTGIAFIHTTEYRATEPAFDDGPDTLAALAAHHSTLPVIANGQLDEPTVARRMLDLGASVVALGKAALTHRDWPERVRRGTPVDGDLPGDVLSPLADIKDWEYQQ